jgi:hypothetical protein
VLRTHRIVLILLTALSAIGFTEQACAQAKKNEQVARRKINGSADVTYQNADTENAELGHGKPTVAASLVEKTWDPKDARATCKVFHHLFAPDGTQLTKGLGGKFEHHRGLFTGWNKTKIGDKTYDFWHLNKGEYQRFGGYGTSPFLKMGKDAQIALIDRCDHGGANVIREQRGLEVTENYADYYVLHLRSKFMTVRKDVVLSGDAHHAGQQFRALQQFAEENAKPVVYVRPEGAKAVGNDIWTNCNWTAGTLELEKASYTVLQVDGRDNPGKSKWSTRPYGRFGVTRTTTVKKSQPVFLNQFFVIANGKRDAAWCAEQAAKLRGDKTETPKKRP